MKFLFKKIMFLSALIIIVLFIPFIVGEFYIRFYHNNFKVVNEMDINNYRTADPVLHHRFIPNGKGRFYYKEYKTRYFINSYGFRDREYSLKKPFGSYRIITLGDSFAEGYGVNIEDVFSKQLENKLNNEWPKDKYKYFEVINGGIAAYSSILEYLFLKNKCLIFNPDLVILFLDYSDFGDNMRYSSRALFDESGMPLAVKYKDEYMDDLNLKNNPLSSFISKYSMFYVYLHMKIHKVIAKYKRNNPSTKPRLGDPLIDRFFLFRDKVYVYDNSFDKYSIENNSLEAISNPLDLTFKYLKMAKDICAKKGIKFLVVIYPYGHQVTESEWGKGRVDFGFMPGEIYDDFLKYENLIRKFAEKYDIEILSLFQNFKDAQMHPLYYEWDGHWTKNGHYVVAEGVYKYLISGRYFD